jgi:hypothetical protein
MLMARFEEEGLILTDRRRNRLAWDLLVTFSNRVDELREKQRKLQTIRPEQDLYRNYWSCPVSVDEWNLSQ